MKLEYPALRIETFAKAERRSKHEQEELFWMPFERNEVKIRNYGEVMEEIKRRIAVIDFFLFGKGHALFQPTTVESVGLQLRKILELVAFGSLVANKDVYSAVHSNFSKHWRAKELLKDLETANPDFYPRPVIENPSGEDGVRKRLVLRQGDYLEKGEFPEVYDHLSELIHARNPYRDATDYAFYEQRFPIWRTRIINLLNCHEIRLKGDPDLWLIHMKEPQDEKVHWYVFQPAGAIGPKGAGQ